MKNKWIVMLFVFLIMLGMVSVHAEGLASSAGLLTDDELLVTTYEGEGVIKRRFPKNMPQTKGNLIEVAYMKSFVPYVVLGVPSTWEAYCSGGNAPYTYTMILYKQNDSGNYSGTYLSRNTTDNTVTLKLTEEGVYFIRVQVTDASGQYLQYNSRRILPVQQSDETDPDTVAGKVNAIVSEYVLPSMGDYSRAKVLHDWLMVNADYDYTYVNKYPEGVLLKGSGTCMSYALSYQMLLTASGLKSIYVTGDTGENFDGYHAWNLVTLDGDWYHIDTTWDDIGNGSYYYEYFCLNDAQMAVDHVWNQNEKYNEPLIPLAPEAPYNPKGHSVYYDFTFSTMEEYDAHFRHITQTLGHRKVDIYGLYTGSDPADIFPAYREWISEMVSELYGNNSVTSISSYHSVPSNKVFLIRCEWTDQAGYIRFQEGSCYLSINDTVAAPVAECDPDGDLTKFRWTSSNTSVATVDSNGDVTGVSPGTATITATAINGGYQASFTVEVMSPTTHEFHISFVANAAGDLTIDWDTIPGATTYDIQRTSADGNTYVQTVNDSVATYSANTMNTSAYHTFRIVAKRIIDGDELFRMVSETAVYFPSGATITYDAILPAFLNTIGTEAFAGDTSLKSVKMLQNVTTIGARAFSGCTALTYVSIPASVSSIATDAFANCPLQFAEIADGSYAETYFQTYFPDVILIYP